MSLPKVPAAAEKRATRDVPERIGKYVIINEVGQGSTGRVFLSHDPYYGRDVAIKLYNIESEEDEQKARVTRKMFFNEAQMMGRLQHPNILPIYDAGEENGAYYVVTEHVHGARTLNAYCRPDNLLRIDDVAPVIRIVRQEYAACAALSYLVDDDVLADALGHVTWGTLFRGRWGFGQRHRELDRWQQYSDRCDTHCRVERSN